MSGKIQLIALIILFILPLSCSSDWQTYSNAFSISSCQKLDRDIGFAKIRLTVKNNSSLTMGCYAYIKIKKNNTIIETSSLVFSSLNPEESQVEEAWFSRFDKHDEYDRAEISLHWNIDSTNYQKDYVY